MFINAMIFFSYSVLFYQLDTDRCEQPKTNWVTLQQSLNIFDRKPLSDHHCRILGKHNILSFDNFETFKYACTVYKTLHGLGPPQLNEYIKLKMSRGTTTRATARGDCEVPYRRTTFGQTVLLVRGSTIWNNIYNSRIPYICHLQNTS